jgi:hypothetical protein
MYEVYVHDLFMSVILVTNTVHILYCRIYEILIQLFQKGSK